MCDKYTFVLGYDVCTVYNSVLSTILYPFGIITFNTYLIFLLHSYHILGTWQQQLIVPDLNLMKIPRINMPTADVQKDEKYARLFEIAFLSSISVNPCTSYRLLHDFSQLKRGDVIIQNAANRLVYILHML